MKLFVIAVLAAGSFFDLSCSPADKSSLISQISRKSQTQNSNHQVATNDPVNPEPSKDQVQQSLGNQILLFNGIGTSVSDWQSLVQIINSMGLTYQLVNSASLNAMSLSTLKNYKMILIPGGNSNVINSALTTATMIRVRQAVRDGGVNFLGICAGAFDAVGVDTFSNSTAYYGFAVAEGAYLKHWYPNGNSILITAIVPIVFADKSSRYMMWWDGPTTPEFSGGVVARYPDGKPAISQKFSGAGFVIVSGVHPEAPASWQYDSGVDLDGTDFDIAKKLIAATLYRKPMVSF